MNFKTINAWAAKEKGSSLTPFELPVPQLNPRDVLIEVKSCGICHSDLHLIDNDWYISKYPLVPGHEVVGRVVKTGSSSSRLKEGQWVGVGWQRSACGDCELCLTGRDNMCSSKLASCVGHHGGYANLHITDERYAFELPEAAQLSSFAPLLCGGITVFSPLAEFMKPKMGMNRVGVVGLGGLGHLAVKFSVALGYGVTVFSSSDSKASEAKAMGIERFVGSSTPEKIESVGRSLDLIIVTANADLPWDSYIKTLKVDGTLCFVGIPPSPVSVNLIHMLDQRRRITASPIGSRARIYEMINFASRKNIQADIETFKFADCNKALEKVRTNSVRYRAVLES